MVNNLVAGTIKSYNNFHFVVVYGSGHMVPLDQPTNAYDMFSNFIDQTIGFNDEVSS